MLTDEAAFDSLGFDSLEIVELVGGLEEEFVIRIPDSDIGSFKTVGDAVRYIEGKEG